MHREERGKVDFMAFFRCSSGGSSGYTAYQKTGLYSVGGYGTLLVDCTDIPNYSSKTIDDIIVRFDKIGVYSSAGSGSSSKTLSYSYNSATGELTISSSNLFASGKPSAVTLFVKD